MPPFKLVETLYSKCLIILFRRICKLIKADHNNQELRKLLVSSLHAGIREEMVQMATAHCRYDIPMLLDVLNVLMDKGIKNLDSSGGNEKFFIRPEHCMLLLSKLEQWDSLSLEKLIVKVRMFKPSPEGDRRRPSKYSTAFHRSLEKGLASSLHTLVLQYVCDNEVLRMLGAHCTNLRHLDATFSWLVEDRGIAQLCFKDPEMVGLALSKNGDESGGMLDESDPLNTAELNPCCYSLQEVRIQDTNTSNVGVFVLLRYVRDLRSLGGFIYYRSIGEAICCLYKGRQHRLSLRDLWETCLQPSKAQLIGEAAPHLSSLYTRGNWLGPVSEHLHVSALTVDFDFIDFTPSLESYVLNSGAILRKLVLIDQMHSVDLAVLANSCPLLEELQARVTGGFSTALSPGLPSLQMCRISTDDRESLRSLLVYAGRLSHLEVTGKETLYGVGCVVFTDAVLRDVLVERPRLDSLQELYVLQGCGFTMVGLEVLLNACPNLRLLGDFVFWETFTELSVKALCDDVRDRNLDLTVRYRGSSIIDQAEIFAYVN